MKFVLLLSLLLASGQIAMAASGGTMGKTSTATFDMTLDFEPAVLISNSSGDFKMNQQDWSGTHESDLVKFCIYSNTASHGYKITAKGTTPVDPSNNYGFQADSPTTVDTYFQYKVQFYSNDAGTGTANILQNGQQSANFTGADTQSCNGGFNASMRLDMATKDFNSSQAGHYTDVLQLEVTPVI